MGQVESTINGEEIAILKEGKSPAFGPIAICETSRSFNQLMAVEAVFSH